MTMSGVVITSLGLASNLGVGIVGAAAAQRAGLARRTELTDVTVYEPDDEMEISVVGAPLNGVTDGFMPPGLWLRLGSRCLDDLLDYGALPPLQEERFWRNTIVNWVLPTLDERRFLWSVPDMSEFLNHICVQPFLVITRMKIAPAAVHMLGSGTVAGVQAIRDVAELFAGSSTDRVILLATDSWLDPLSVRSLAADNRIKSGEQPVGLCPGEAGAAILLERHEAAIQRGAQVHASIRAAVTSPPPPNPEEEPHKLRNDNALAFGGQLANVVRQALASAEVATPFVGTIMLDLNGEEWRARAWGTAMSSLVDIVDFDRCSSVIPAISFGDTGAASGVLALCLASRAFARGYATTPQTLVCSLSEDGSTGAILMEAPAA
jgi:3-oxoacyl-[acyl-carrier-protein] synthase-1